MFEYTGKASITHLNIRRGTSDDANVHLDVKLEVEDLDANSAAAALGADDAQSVESALFRPVSQDAERSKRFLSVKSIESDATFEARHAITFHGLRRIRVSKVGKVSVMPIAAGKFNAQFCVAIEGPPENMVELLAERLNRPTHVKLEQDAELPLAGGQVGTPAGSQLGIPLKSDKPGAGVSGIAAKRAAKADIRRALGGNRARKGGKRAA